VISPANSLAETEEGMKSVDTKRRQISRMAFISGVDTAILLYTALIYRLSKCVSNGLIDTWSRTKPNEVGR
jgi:hypothetical protein